MEMALVSLPLMFFIYAIIAFGLILSQKNSITQAATEGARASLSVPGVASPTDKERSDYAVATVLRTLNWMSASQKSHLSITTSISPNTAVGQLPLCNPGATPADTSKCITVTVSYPYNAYPLIPAAPGLGLVTPDTIKAVAVLRVS